MLKQYVIYTVSGQFARIIFATIASAIIARGLGVENRGVYALAIWLPTALSMFAQFGLNATNGTFPGLYRNQRNAIFINSLVIGGICSLLGVAAYAAFFFQGLWDIGRFKLLFDHQQLILMGAVLLPFLVFENVTREFCQGCEFVKETVFITSLSFLFRAVMLAWALVAYNVGVAGVVGIYLFVSFVSIASYLWVVRAYIKIRVGMFSKSLFWKTVKSGFVFMLGSSALALASQIPVFFLSLFSISTSEIGLFSVAWMISTQLQFLPSAVAQAFMPKLSNDLEQSSGKTPMVFKFNAMLCGISMMAMFAVAYPVVLLLVGKEYLGSVNILFIMLPGIAVFGASRVLGIYLWAHQKQLYTTLANWLSLIVTTIFCFILIPQYNGIGAALAVSIGRIVVFISVVISYCYVSKQHISVLKLSISDIKMFYSRMAEMILDLMIRIKKL